MVYTSLNKWSIKIDEIILKRSPQFNDLADNGYGQSFDVFVRVEGRAVMYDWFHT